MLTTKFSLLAECTTVKAVKNCNALKALKFYCPKSATSQVVFKCPLSANTQKPKCLRYSSTALSSITRRCAADHVFRNCFSAEKKSNASMQTGRNEQGIELPSQHYLSCIYNPTDRVFRQTNTTTGNMSVRKSEFSILLVYHIAAAATLWNIPEGYTFTAFEYNNNNNNNNNNNHDDIYSAVIYGASHMREFTVVTLGQSRSAPGGRQLVGQAANLTFESACRLL